MALRGMAAGVAERGGPVPAAAGRGGGGAGRGAGEPGRGGRAAEPGARISPRGRSGPHRTRRRAAPPRRRRRAALENSPPARRRLRRSGRSRLCRAPALPAARRGGRRGPGHQRGQPVHGFVGPGAVRQRARTRAHRRNRAALCFPAAPTPDALVTSGGTESNLLGLLLAREQRCAGPPRCAVPTPITASRAQPGCSASRNRSWSTAPTSACAPTRCAAVLAEITGRPWSSPPPAPPTPASSTRCPPSPTSPPSTVPACTSTPPMAERCCSVPRARRCSPVSTAPTRSPLDLHKFGWQPIPAGVLISADAADLAPLSIPADYLNADDDVEAGMPDLLGRSLRTSRRADAFRIAVSLRALGRAGLAALIDRCCANAADLAAAIDAHPGPAPLAHPDLTTVLLRPRHRRPTRPALGDDLVAGLRRRLLDTGHAVLGRAALPTGPGRHRSAWLKLTLLHPTATVADYLPLLDLIADTADALRAAAGGRDRSHHEAPRPAGGRHRPVQPLARRAGRRRRAAATFLVRLPGVPLASRPADRGRHRAGAVPGRPGLAGPARAPVVVPQLPGRRRAPVPVLFRRTPARGPHRVRRLPALGEQTPAVVPVRHRGLPHRLVRRSRRLRLDAISSGTPIRLSATNIVLGIGTTPSVPAALRPLVADPDSLVLHSADYLDHRDALAGADEVVVIGSGQSGAEVFLDLLRRRPVGRERLRWLARTSALAPMEYSKLGLEHFTPDYTRFFHGLPEPVRARLVDAQWQLYKGISAETMAEIHDELYRRSVHCGMARRLDNARRRRPGRTPGREAVRTRSRPRSGPSVAAPFPSTASCSRTGYTERALDRLLGSLNDRRSSDTEGRLVVDADYRVRLDPAITGALFVQNAEMHTHGVGAPDLGLGAWRAATILNSISARDVFRLPRRTAFTSFGLRATTKARSILS